MSLPKLLSSAHSLAWGSFCPPSQAIHCFTTTSHTSSSLSLDHPEHNHFRATALHLLLFFWNILSHLFAWLIAYHSSGLTFSVRPSRAIFPEARPYRTYATCNSFFCWHISYLLIALKCSMRHEGRDTDGLVSALSWCPGQYLTLCLMEICWVKKWKHQWINKWMNEWMNEWMKNSEQNWSK